MTTINLRAVQYNIEGTVGDSVTLTATVTDGDGVAVDVSTYDIEAVVLRGGLEVATFGDTVTGVDSNVITLTLSAAQTTTIGSDRGATWSMSVTNAGNVQQWLAGTFELAEVGRPRTGAAPSPMTLVVDGTISVTVTEGAGSGAGTAVGTSVSDAGEYYDGEDVEAVLQEVGASLADKVSKTGGGGRSINTQEDVSGSVELDLAEGSVQIIDGSTGTFTLTVAGASGTGEVDWLLKVTASHAPTWFAGLTWPNGLGPIDWDGTTTHVFAFNSTNGGTATLGWHLTPAARVLAAPPLTVAGVLTTGNRTGYPLYNDSGIDRTIVGVRGSLAVASASTTVLVDVHADGTTIFTTQSNRVTMASAATTDLTETVENDAWLAGDAIIVGIDQTDGTAAGLTVTVLYTEAS